MAKPPNTSLATHLAAPVVLAPLAGGPSTPELAAAVSEAEGLGFLGGGYLSADALAERIAQTRKLTARPFGVNLFVPGDGPAEPQSYAPYLEHLHQWARERSLDLGEARFDDDDFPAKLALLERARVPVVSFTFGCPAGPVIESLRDTGTEVWVTVTRPEEAQLASAAGADVLVAQGAEAGGHRGSFIDRHDVPPLGLLPLLSLLRASVPLPLVASGAVTTGAALAATLCAGAAAAQIGTAFMLAPEAGTSRAHRQAISRPGDTALTRAFTGRLARGIRNRFMQEHDDAPTAYPELHYATAPMRRYAREHDDPELINLWAGEAHELAQELPAGEIVERLVNDARIAIAAGAARLSR